MTSSRIALGTLALAASLLTSLAGVASATSPDEPPVREDLIADTLLALGLDPAVVEEVIAAVGSDVSNELGRMLDDGLVTDVQLDTLAAEVSAGTLPESIGEIAAQTRVRRDAYRAAAVETLDELGVEVPPGVPVSEALADNSIDPDDFVALLPEDLPPPVHDGVASATTTLPPTTLPPTAGPSTTAPPTTAPPVTVPDSTYPTTDPAGSYPATQPSEYPVTPAEPSISGGYPVTGSDSAEGSGDGDSV